MSYSEDYKREIVFIFFAQKRLILRITVAVAVLSILIALFWPRTYAATGKVLLNVKKLESGPEVLDKERNTRFYPVTAQDLMSEMEILSSHDVAQKAVEILYEKELSSAHPQERGVVLQKEIGRIERNLVSKMVPGSNVIEVQYFDSNSQRAARILNVLMNQYISYRTQILNPVQEKVFYVEQLKKFKDGLAEKQNQLMALAERTKSSSPEQTITTNLQIKKELEDQLNVLSTDAIDKQLRFDYLGHVLSTEIISNFSFADNQSINEHHLRIQELYHERGGLLRTYLPASAKVKLIDEQIKRETELLRVKISALKNQLHQGLKVINEKKKDITKKIEDLNKRNIELQKQILEAERLTSEIALLRASYETFYKKAEEAKINTSVSAGNVPLYISMLSHASASDEPVFPWGLNMVPIGIIIGFIFGCSIGFLKEYFDHTFKRPCDVKNYAGLPVVLSIPNFEEKKPKNKFEKFLQRAGLK